MKIKFYFIIILSLSFSFAKSKTDFKGQLITSPSVNYNNEYNISGSIQYLPIIEFQKQSIKYTYTFDFAGKLFTNFETHASPESRSAYNKT